MSQLGTGPLHHAFRAKSPIDRRKRFVPAMLLAGARRPAERELGVQVGVDRTSVHGVLRILQASGMVTVRPVTGSVSPTRLLERPTTRSLRIPRSIRAAKSSSLPALPME